MDSTEANESVVALEEQLNKANLGSDTDPATHPRTYRSNSTSIESTTAEHPATTTNTGVSDSSSDPPKATRRKSSLVTLESKLHRTPSTEKHVTIQLDDDAKNDKDGDRSGYTDGVSTSDINAHGSLSSMSLEQDAASKKELAKILEQFDPLGESSESSGSIGATKNKDLGIDDIVIQDRGIAPSKLRAPSDKTMDKDNDRDKKKDNEKSDEKERLTTLSPSPSNSSEASPVALGSPQTSHDVVIPPTAFNKASSTSTSPSSKTKSSSKKKAGDASKSKSSGKETDVSRRSEASSSEEKPKTIPFDFHKFLEQMRHRSALPITGYFQSFLKEFGRRPWTVNEQIKIIHDFLEFIAGKMEMCDLWKNASEQEMDNLREGMEKLVMNRLFAYTFSPNTADDAERDNVLTQKIQIFRWIREEHLDIPKSSQNEAYLTYAQAELKKINSYKAPRDKVICILNCCKFIFTFIRRSEGSGKGADTFLPILIFVVIRANPPHLVSNVQYISRFRNPEKLQAEAGYYLASLMGAISFIENLEASSLSITPQEFDQQIERTMEELAQEKRAAEQALQQQRQQANGGADSRINEKSPPRNATPQQRGAGKFSFFGSSASTSASPQQPNTGARRRAASMGQQQEEFNEKAALKQEMQRQEQQLRQEQSQQQRLAADGSNLPKEESSSSSSSSFSPWMSIVNPAAALIEKGAQTASRTIQKPMQLMEKIFQESDDEEIGKSHSTRPNQQQQEQQSSSLSPARPPAPTREDSFGEFMYVPAGEENQVPSPQQNLYPGALGGSPMEHNQGQRTRSRTMSGPVPVHPQTPQGVQQQGQPSMTREQYQQALETLRDMFPTCEPQVIDTILQANEGRVTPSIDNLLEIALAADQQQQGSLQPAVIIEDESSGFVTLEHGQQGDYPENDQGVDNLSDIVHVRNSIDAPTGVDARADLDGQDSADARATSPPPSRSAPENQERGSSSTSPKQASADQDLISF
ncbi:hypothetical protein BGW41_007517 [Actinomortierella wolfii]|nr:hypothetical protein BGW41_007517 [Actinomortierella wolfii]